MTVVDHPATGRLGPDERAELERLRAELAELRAATPTVESKAPPKPGRDRHGWRWVAVALLLVLAGLFTLGSVTTRFVRAEILDTDHYVATIAPLGSDPAVQAQVVDTITGEINSRVDVEGLTTQALTALTDLTPADRPRLDQAVVGLAPVLAGQAQNFIHDTVARFVGSPSSKTCGSPRTERHTPLSSRSSPARPTTRQSSSTPAGRSASRWVRSSTR